MVAELGTHKMFRSELEAVTNLAVDNEDSVRMADAYIRQWATDILFYDKAHAHEDPELEALVDDYRRSLYVHRYEERPMCCRSTRPTKTSTVCMRIY